MALKAFRVRYIKESTVTDRYSMVVFAADAEAAKQRLEAAMKGDIDLTDDEAGTEQHEKEIDSDGGEFSALCEDDYDAPEELDALDVEQLELEVPESVDA